jgi:hypothetical protein
MTIIHHNGQPWRLQNDFNAGTVSSIVGWDNTSSTLLYGLTEASVVVTKNRVYIVGGYGDIGGVFSVKDNTFTAVINTDGTLGTWSAGPSLALPMSESQAFTTKNHAHMVSGITTGNAYTLQTNTAEINADGTITAWTIGQPIPANRMYSSVIVTKDKVFLLGGWDGTFMSSSIVAAINEDGTLGTWGAGPAIPVGLMRSQAVSAGDFIYLLGGQNASGTSAVVQKAPIDVNGDIGTWTTSETLNTVRKNACSVITGNKIHLFGGHGETVAVNTSSVADVDASGNIGTWSAGGTLLADSTGGNTLITSAYVYWITGETPSRSTTVFKAPFTGGLNDYSTVGFEDTSVNVAVDAPIPAITGAFYDALIAGAVVPQKVELNAVAITTVVLNGNVTPDTVSISGVMVNASLVTGRFIAPLASLKTYQGSVTDIPVQLPTVSSFAITPIMSNTEIVSPMTAVSSEAYTYPVSTVTFHIKLPGVTSLVSTPGLTVCDIKSSVPSVNSFMLLEESINVGYEIATPKIVCSFLRPVLDDYVVIKNIREGICH